ncbi:MAG: hypothetical protein ACKOA8_19455 [Deltaproteobacteria bacterium]
MRRKTQEQGLKNKFSDIYIPEKLRALKNFDCIFGAWVDSNPTDVGLVVKDANNSIVTTVHQPLGSSSSFFTCDGIDYEIETLHTWFATKVLKGSGSEKVLIKSTAGYFCWTFERDSLPAFHQLVWQKDRFRFWSPDRFSGFFEDRKLVGGIWPILNGKFVTGRALVVGRETPMPIRVFLLYLGLSSW